jgi:hypothetical protein
MRRPISAGVVLKDVQEDGSIEAVSSRFTMFPTLGER